MAQNYATSIYSQKSMKSLRSIGHASMTNVKDYFKRWFKREAQRTHPEVEKKTTESICSSTETVAQPRHGPVGILVHREKETEEERKERRRRQRKNKIQYYYPSESSSSDTLSERRVCFKEDAEPRILFASESPVPRFRNEVPTPPSPPYLSIRIDRENDDIVSIILDEPSPTVYTTPTPKTGLATPLSEHERRIQLWMQSGHPPKDYRLVFKQPYYRGQTLTFALQNPLPEDHIVFFKFMTTSAGGEPERFLVQPSAGKLDSLDETEIRLFLNRAPLDKKDTIIIRWAVLQIDNQIQNWVQKELDEPRKRQWIDLLDQTWPEQLSLKLTKIKVDFS
ncbi:hypothetical protein BY458DRAFT_525719 [Sporodiniella umbellata]|nr:hypothetical protein BY458DRAFT_525719 [Sporodiniella umbellata]